MGSACATYVPSLSEPQVLAVARQTHGLWGTPFAVDEHGRHVLEQLRRAGSLLRYAGLVLPGGEVGASLKRYRLTLATPEGSWPAVGLGAIFTHPERRREGLGAALCHAILREAAAEGARAALLFSDIGSPFYERLGFRPLPALVHACPTADLPAAGALCRQPTEDLASLGGLRTRSLAGRVHLSHTTESWRYFAWRSGARAHFTLRDGARLAGFCTLSRRHGGLWVDEIAAPEVPPHLVLATLREAAEATASASVAGWLPAELAMAPFTSRPRLGCLPMLMGLDAEAHTALRDAPAHFGTLDAF